MNTTTAVSRLEVEVAKLQPAECAELLHRLIESVWADADIEAAWSREIERRSALVDAGEMSHQPASAVFDALRRKIS